MPARTTHIVPRDAEWAVKREGAAKAVGVCSTQGKAIEVAHRMVKRSSSGQVVIHVLSGRIRVLESHGLPRVQKAPKASRIGRKQIEKAVSVVIRERL